MAKEKAVKGNDPKVPVNVDENGETRGVAAEKAQAEAKVALAEGCD